MPRAAREVAAERRDTGQCARGDPVTVDIQVAREAFDLLEVLCAQHFPAVGTILVVPPQPAAHPVVHTDVEIGHHEYGRLKTLREVECLDGEIETLLGICRKECDVFRVSM